MHFTMPHLTLPQTKTTRHITTRPAATLSALALTLTLCAPPAVAAGVAELLDRVPGDADVIVAIPDVGELNGDLASLSQRHGLPLPFNGSLMALAKLQLGEAGQALDEAGGAVLYFSGIDDDALMQADAMPEPVVLLPVTDYARFAQGLGGEAEGVTELTLPEELMGEGGGHGHAQGHAGAAGPGGGHRGAMSTSRAYAKGVDGFAVVSRDRALVEGYAAGMNGQGRVDRLGSAGTTAATGCDVMIYVDLERMGPILADAVAFHRGNMLGQMDEARDRMLDSVETGDMDMPFEDAEQFDAMIEQARMWMDLYGEAAINLSRGLDAVALVADLSPEAMTFDIAYRAKPGSYVGKLIQPVAAAGDASRTTALLDLLPAGPYISATSADMAAWDLRDLLDTMLDRIPMDEPGLEFFKSYEHIQPMLDQIERVGSVYYVPDLAALMMGEGSLMNVVRVIDAKDPAKLLDASQTYIESLDGMQIPAGMDMTGQPMKMTFTAGFERDAMQVAGVSVHRFNIAFDMPIFDAMNDPNMGGGMGGPGGNPIAAGIAQFMEMFAKQEGYMATIGERVIATTNRSMLPQAINAVRAAGNANQIGIGQVEGFAAYRAAMLGEGLAEHQLGEAYFNPRDVIGMVAPMAMNFGFAVPQPPRDLPPMMFALADEADSTLWRMSLPDSLLGYLIEVGRAAQDIANQMNGMGPGGPGGMGPGGSPFDSPPPAPR